MKKILVLIPLISLFILFIATDTLHIDDQYEIEYVIGVSQCNLGEPWRIQMNKDIIKEASKHHHIKLIMFDASQNNDKQIEDIKKLLNFGVDLIIVSPNEAIPLTPIVSEANKEVPVIILDRETSNDQYTLYIGADNYLIGQQIGQYVINLANGRDFSLLEIKGLIGSAPTIQRSEGFRDAIKSHNNLKITSSIEGNWLRDTAEVKTFDLISEKKQFDLVYSHNDPMALGAYNAFLTTGELPIFIGIDGLSGKDGGLNLVKQDILKSTFTYPTGGKEAIQYALKILNNEPIEKKRVLLHSTQVTLDNIDLFYKKDNLTE